MKLIITGAIIWATGYILHLSGIDNLFTLSLGVGGVALAFTGVILRNK